MYELIITEKGGSKQTLQVTDTEITMGRVQGNQVILPRGNVSKKHARLVFDGQSVKIEDLGSTNGTYINGRRITQLVAISPKDNIYIGEFIIQLVQAESSKSKSGEHGAEEAKPPLPPVPEPKLSQKAAPSSFASRTSFNDNSDNRTEALSGIEDLDEEGSTENYTVSPPPKITTSGLSSQFLKDTDLFAQVEHVQDVLFAELKNLDRKNIPLDLDEGTASKIRLFIKELLDQIKCELPPEFDIGVLMETTFRAVVHLGPLSDWLNDDTISEIKILNPKQILLRRKTGLEPAGVQFESESSLSRYLRCLCAGHNINRFGPSASLIQYRLYDGPLVTCTFTPKACSGTSARILKSLARPLTAPSTIKSGIKSEPFSILKKSIQEKSKIAVIGNTAPLRMSMVTDITRLLSGSDTVVGVETFPTIQFQGARTIGFSTHTHYKNATNSKVVFENTLWKAVDLSPDWLVTSGVSFAEMPGIIALATGRRGIISDLPIQGSGPITREIIAGFATQGLVLQSQQVSSLLWAAFDVIVDVAMSKSGKTLVKRIFKGDLSGDKWISKIVYDITRKAG